MTSPRVVGLGPVAALAQGCAASHTYSRTEGESQEPAAQIRYERVQTLREEAGRVDSEPAEDALSGAFVGDAVGAYRPAMLFGSAGGNTLGAFATDDRAEARRFGMRASTAGMQLQRLPKASSGLPEESCLLGA